MVSTAIIILRIFSPNKWNLYYFALWQSYSCLCLFVICVCYTCISIKFLCGGHPPHHGAANRERKLTVALLLMTVISLIMWLPYALGSFINLTTNTFRSIPFQDNVRWNFFNDCSILCKLSCKSSFIRYQNASFQKSFVRII